MSNFFAERKSARPASLAAVGWSIFLSLCVCLIFWQHPAWAAQQENAAKAQPVAVQLQGGVDSVQIAADKQNVKIDYHSEGDAAGTDGKVYLVELPMYEKKLPATPNIVAQAGAGERGSFSLPLQGGSEDRLYNAYLMAVKTEQGYQPVGNRHFITNPELIAPNQQPYPYFLSKKGLQVELNMLDDAMSLGVKHASINISTGDMLGEGIDFQYEGQTYHFNAGVVAQYDAMVSGLSGKSLTVTAIILNGWDDDFPQLRRPGLEKSAQAAYYLFNTETPEGVATTRALAAFLAQRYDGKHGHGKVTNWIVGNEVNNQHWNYYGKADLQSYIQAYADAFRVFYQAIKSHNANDRVYFSLDFYWNYDKAADNKLRYKAKEVVDSFNQLVSSEGNMDWGLAYHPYPHPMVEPEFWDDGKSGLLTQDENTPVLNFYNLKVLTDYFHKTALLNPRGEVRSIALTEEGFSSQSQTRGELLQEQAAAFAYSYYLVDSNPDIDFYNLSRQVDAPEELKQGLAFGLYYTLKDDKDANRSVAFLPKPIYRVFKYIDRKDKTLEATAFAKPIIGINKWSDVIPNFRWASQER